MTVAILPGLYRAPATRDLARLCPPDCWSIDTYGFLAFKAPTRPSAGSLLLEFLAKQPGVVYIAGSEGAAQATVAGQAIHLNDIAGATFLDSASQGPQATVGVYYDTTNNYGVGYWVRGLDGKEIDCPSHMVLGHELGHARQVFEGGYTNEAAAEVYAVTIENDLRGADTPVLPFRQGHDGGRKTPPEKTETNTTPPRTRTGCFVATAAYGSALHPVVGDLRALRDQVLRPTRAGSAFFADFYEDYDRISAPLVEAMHADDDLRELVRRCIVAPLVHYFLLGRDLPDLPLEEAGPWAPFLEGVREGVEEFVSVVPLPSRLGEIPPERAAEELMVALRYQLRSPARRRAWLEQLQVAGELPLACTSTQASQLAELLHEAGRSENEIAAILGPARPSHVALAAFGKDLGTGAEATRWRYTVTLRNATPDQTYLALRVYYLAEPGGMTDMGVVTLDDLKPGEVGVFPLCECTRLQSYYIDGDFEDTAGRTGSFVFPDQGSMTPDTAAALGDPNPCEDSWAF